MKNYWPHAILFGGISIVLALVMAEEALTSKIPPALLQSFIPIDSLAVKDRTKLTFDRNGTSGAALLLDGVRDYLQIDSPSSSLPYEFSFCFWTRIDTTGVEQTLFQKGEDCPDGDYDFKGLSYAVKILADGRLTARIVAPDGNYTASYLEVASSEPIPIAAWTFIVISFKHSDPQFELFVDVKPIPVKIHSNGSLLFERIYDSKARLKIGASENYCGYVHSYQKFFKGAMDDVRIFTKPLTGEEMRILFEPEKRMFVKYRIAIFVLLFLFVTMVAYHHWKDSR